MFFCNTSSPKDYCANECEGGCDGPSGRVPRSSSDAELETSWNTSVIVLVLRGKDPDDRLGTELDCTLYLVFLLNRSHCSAWK